MSEQSSAARSEAPPPAESASVTLRSLIVATLLAILSGYWERQAGMVGHAVQLGEAVPVIPAVAALSFFLLVNPLLARIHPKLSFTRAEVTVVFIVLSVALIINSIGLMRMLLPAMIAPLYYMTPENKLAVVWEKLPEWFGPRGEDVIFDAFRGHAPGIPWLAWLPGLLTWFVFCFALFYALQCLAVVFRRQWAERERLTFPLMQVVEEILPVPGKRFAPILRDPFFWAGIGISVFYNLIQMAHAFFPAFPSIGRSFDIGAGLESRPFNALRPLAISYRPELLALGYLMSLEVTFSIWFTYLLLRFSRLVGALGGWVEPTAPFPHDQSQAMGAFVALALISMWLGRQAWIDVFRAAFARGGVDDEREPMSYRAALIGLVAGFAVVLSIGLQAGMGWTLALLYFFFVFTVAFTYTRIRAETGAPMVWLFPFWQQEKMIYAMFGGAPFLLAGGGQPLISLAFFTWLSRGYFPNAAMSIQMESFKLAADNKVSLRQIHWVLLYAMVIGFMIAVWIHLDVYYDMGADYAEGGGRARLQNSGYVNAANILGGQPFNPEPERAGAGLFGFFAAAMMFVGRLRLIGFPLHPLGYAMAAAYGHPLWGPALFIWVFKLMVLRAGGIKLFRRFIPLFIGILLGHFFAAGVVWGMVAVFNPDVTYNYVVYFG